MSFREIGRVKPKRALAEGLGGGCRLGPLASVVFPVVLALAVSANAEPGPPTDALLLDEPLLQDPQPAEDGVVGLLSRLAERMDRIAGRVREGEAGPKTQQEQLLVLDHLDELLQGAGSAAPRPRAASPTSDPANGGRAASETPGGAAGEQSAAAEQERFRWDGLNTIWGQLPKTLQEQLRNPLHEDFLPGYRQQIIEYYRRLSQVEGGR